MYSTMRRKWKQMSNGVQHPLNCIFFPYRWKQYKLSLSLVKKRFRDFSHFLRFFFFFKVPRTDSVEHKENTIPFYRKIYSPPFSLQFYCATKPVAYFVTNCLSYHHVYPLFIIQEALESHANLLGFGKSKFSWYTDF